MPLPTTGSFSVLGYTRPGEAVQSKPKQAFIVRMSPEALDALQDFPNNPPMDFEFGDSPGIWIGSTFFPLSSYSENSTHDLYLRASSATKKNPPFKLHANVVGRFTVQRELAPSVGEKIRESTTDAMNQRANRTTVRIDDLKDLPAAPTKQSKKKKESATSTAASHSRTSSSTSLLDKAKNKAMAVAARTSMTPVASNPLDKLSPERVDDLKRRLVHWLAAEQRTEEDTVRAVGGPNCNIQTRQAVLRLLDDYGELAGKSKLYRLKQRSWTEVRPFEWKNWSEAQRTQICRDGRANLKALGIPETNAVWDHFTPPPLPSNPFPTSSSTLSAPGSRGTPEPKRPVAASRDKASSANKPKPKSETMAKDESRAASRNGRESPINTSRSAPGSGRKLPSSGGAKTGATSSKLASSSSARGTEMPPPSRNSPSTSSQSGSAAAHARAAQRARAGSVQDSDSERRRPGHVNQPSKLAQRARGADDFRDSDVERHQRSSDRDGGRVRGKEREAESDKEWQRERGREGDREKRRDLDDRDRKRDRGDRQRDREESDRDRDRERAKERNTDRARNRERESDRDGWGVENPRRKDLRREREEGETSDASSASLLKRKGRARNDEDDDFQPSKSSAKRRRTEAETSSLPPKPKVEEVPVSRNWSKQPETERQRQSSSTSIKKEPSPLPSFKKISRPSPPPPSKRSLHPSSASTVYTPPANNGASKGSKPKPKYRRGSSIYTSSEDEGELPQTSKSRAPANSPTPEPPRRSPLPPIPPPSASSSRTPSTAASATPLQTNGTGRTPSVPSRAARAASKPYSRQERKNARIKYTATHSEYAELRHKIRVQREKNESLLLRDDSSGSGTESTGEADLMSQEDLAALIAQYNRKRDELEAIRRDFENGVEGVFH